MSYGDRKVRRRQIAQDIADGMTVAGAMEKWDCAIYLVQRSLKEHGIKAPRKKPSPRLMGKTLQILARLLMPQHRETFGTIARDLRIARQRVDQVYREAMLVGFKMDKWKIPTGPGIARVPHDNNGAPLP